MEENVNYVCELLASVRHLDPGLLTGTLNISILVGAMCVMCTKADVTWRCENQVHRRFCTIMHMCIRQLL